MVLRDERKCGSNAGQYAVSNRKNIRYPSGTEQSKERTLQPGFLNLEHPSLKANCGAKLVRAARLQNDRHSSASDARRH